VYGDVHSAVLFLEQMLGALNGSHGFGRRVQTRLTVACAQIWGLAWLGATSSTSLSNLVTIGRYQHASTAINNVKHYPHERHHHFFRNRSPSDPDTSRHASMTYT